MQIGLKNTSKKTLSQAVNSVLWCLYVYRLKIMNVYLVIMMMASSKITSTKVHGSIIRNVIDNANKSMCVIYEHK